MNRIKTGDNVVVIAGKSIGKQGKVLKVISDKGNKGDKIIVEGINLMKKHQKPNPQLQQKGGIIEREAPLHVSNVAHWNSQTNRADRVGFRFVEKDGRQLKVRYLKSTKEDIDIV